MHCADASTNGPCGLPLSAATLYRLTGGMTMHRTEIFAINLRDGTSASDLSRRWNKHNLLPVGPGCRLGARRQIATVKFRTAGGSLLVFDAEFQKLDNTSYIKVPSD